MPLDSQVKEVEKRSLLLAKDGSEISDDFLGRMQNVKLLLMLVVLVELGKLFYQMQALMLFQDSHQHKLFLIFMEKS